MSRKLRADSLEARLKKAGKPEAITALDQWLFEEGVTLSAACSRLQSDFGFKFSLAAMHRFYHARKAERAVNRIKDSREIADMINALGSEEQIDAATAKVVSQLAFDLASSPNPDPKAVSQLLKAIISKQSVKLDERRVTLLETKAKQADAAKEVMGNETLSTEERAQKMRQIFGMT